MKRMEMLPNDKVFKGLSVILLFFCLLLPGSTKAIGNVNNLSFDFYSQEDGLSNNQIHCILQDKKGWMWFGTSQGINRFDGYNFTVFAHNPDDSTSLRGNLVRVIFEDSKERLWVGTEQGGLNLFDSAKEKFGHPFQTVADNRLRGTTVASIAEDPQGNIWVGTDSRLFKIVGDKQLMEILPSNNPSFSDYFRVIRSDRNGRIWIGTDHGLWIYNPDTNQIQRVSLPNFSNSNEEIWEIVPDDDNTMWIGTYSNGLYHVNISTLTAAVISLDETNDRSRTVRAIAKDKSGKYWIGTRGGLYIYEKGRGVTSYYNHDEREPKSLVNNSILCVVHDVKGDVWIGTRSGINFLIEERQNILGYKAIPADTRYLNSSEIYGFWAHPNGELWIATESGGVNIFNRNTGRFRYLKREDDKLNSLTSNCIKALIEDQQGNIWIGTFMGGMNVLNQQTGKITHYLNDPTNPNSLSDNRIWAIACDKQNNIWIATNTEINKFDYTTKSFIRYPEFTNGQQINWLSIDSQNQMWMGTRTELFIRDLTTGKSMRFPESVRYVLEDSKGRFWLATQNKGIALFSKEKGVEEFYNEKSGLVNNQTLTIQEDNQGYLWISTSNGLSKFNPESERFRNYTLSDGFLNNQFCYGAALKLASGELLFGGVAGFNIFDPGKLNRGSYVAPIVLTGLRIFNKNVPIGDSPKDILTRSISQTDHIAVDYDQNVITFDFASLDYANSKGLQYSYFLEGFDKEWNEPSSVRSVTYTNLDPDSYRFRVKTVSIDRKESSAELVLAVDVLPPFWRTWWFRLILLLTFVGLIYTLIDFLLNREKLKNELVYEKFRAKKLHELDMMKLRFFTNISHEIRTPLTLILGPLEKMRSHAIPERDIPGHLDVMYRNATQLLGLINQLLDFRKLESGSLKLSLSRGDMVTYIGGLVHSFDNLAEEKGIELKFNSVRKEIIASFDSDKVGKIITNLLSNAFKFTQKGGTISVNISLVIDNDGSSSPVEKKLIEITVKDDGIGIAESNLQKIFVRFFQENGSNGQGTGIGLALAKELVKLHQGTITVSSKPGKGAKFIVRLPYYEEQAKVDDFVSPGLAGELSKSVETVIEKDSEQVDAQIQRIILLIDDNADVRYFIKSHFISNYQVLEAAGGAEGWQIALKTIPDIIISDVMMPEMDGFEFCRKVRKDERTSHIPILLLTALGSREHEIEGISSGADDYIVKPFDLAILQTKVENLLALRQSLKQKFTGEMVLQPRNVVISSPDERFLHKAIEVVEHHISDPDFDIEKFAIAIGVSRMQLYRKLDALTEMTVKEFIRNIRLKRATQLLIQKKMNVSEVAYAVGFRDLSHFRKCFRQEFGMSASEFASHQQMPE